MSAAPRASFSSSRGDSAEFESDLTLNDRLKVFKAPHFDPGAYVTSKCHTMNEKEIRHLCAYLVNLKQASAEEMRKSVYANYSAFIRTSKEISDLEGQLLSLKNLLSTQATLVHSLAEGIHIESISTGHEGLKREEDSALGRGDPSMIEKWLGTFLDTLEVLLAERRVDEALAALDEGENIAEEATDPATRTSATFLSLQNAITQQRLKLADQLAETATQPSTRGVELRSSVLALKHLGDGIRAHTLLLNSHGHKLQSSIQNLRPSTTSCSGTFTASLSRLVFSTIAQAASDSQTLFSEEPAYSSELVTWAVKQSEAFALLVKRYALASAAAASSLRAAAECVQTCMGYCSLLEARGLALSPVLLKIFRPCVEQTLSANLKRIELSTAAVAAADDWLLAYPPLGSRVPNSTSLGSVIASQPKLSSSAHQFNFMVQEMLEDVGPLESLQLVGLALEGILQVFMSYVNMLINALPGSMENEGSMGDSVPKIVKMAQSEAQQIALLANALLLADELLPRAAVKLSSLLQTNRSDDSSRRAPDRQNRSAEQREIKRRLHRSVDKLRDSFCRHHALELIFTDDGVPRLTAEMYISMDDNANEPEWFPSPIFQELFAKLTRMAGIATDMFVGRERFATLLLMRLTETVILWLSDDQSFWAEIEEGPKPLGPLGLQQLYLDMEFVMLFSSQGRYLSRNLHQVIKNIIARAIDAVAATGTDPYSLMPEDGWFAEVSQIAIKMLTGKANFGNVDREVVSPTASASGKSISSVLSHGSN